MTCNLQEFVGRSHEIGLFDALLEHPTQRVMLLHGVGGIGKSCLLFRVRRDQRRNAQAPLTAFLDFRADSTLSQNEMIVRRLREQLGRVFDLHLGTAETEILRDLAAMPATPDLAAVLPDAKAPAGSLSFGGNVSAQDIVAGNKITISNSTLIFNPDQGRDLLNAEIEQRRNRAFRQALLELVKTEKVVIFLDHFEVAGKVAQRWLLEHLLGLSLYDADLCPNLWIVVGGQQLPFLDQVSQWRHVMKLCTLPPLTQEDVHEFWTTKRSLDPAQALVIAQACAGNPGLLFLMANNVQDALVRSNGERS